MTPLPYLTRTWRAPDGHDGGGWTRTQIEAFKALMWKALIKYKGLPRLVSAWDDGRDCLCWYSARACDEETELRDKCRAIFGVHERAPEA